jgi:hypothetical protein
MKLNGFPQPQPSGEIEAELRALNCSRGRLFVCALCTDIPCDVPLEATVIELHPVAKFPPPESHPRCTPEFSRSGKATRQQNSEKLSSRACSAQQEYIHGGLKTSIKGNFFQRRVTHAPELCSLIRHGPLSEL